MTDLDNLRELAGMVPEGWSDLCHEAANEIERLRALLDDACKVFDHYDLPEHAFHYRRVLSNPEQKSPAGHQ